MSHVDRSAQSKTRLNLLSLEARELPAQLVSLSDQRLLTITGDEKPDIVSIIRNDRAGTITVAGSGEKKQVFKSADVTEIRVDLGAGNDRFDFATAGEVRSPLNLWVELGEGEDTSVIRWADDRSTAKAGLAATVFGGEGSDAIGFRVGSLAKAVNVSLQADGETGNDALAIQSLAPVRGASLDADFNGGDGNDNISSFSTGNLGVDGRLRYLFSGDAGDDSITFNAAGRIDGRLEIRADGGMGDDSLSVAGTDLSGDQRARVRLIGGAGDDQFVTLADSKNANIFVEGGEGTDGGLIISGVSARGLEIARQPTANELLPGPLPDFNPVLKTSTITREGRTLEYWTAGKSAANQPVVVLLTGFGGKIDDWESVPGSLAAKSQVIAVNRPGYGRSDGTSGDYAIAAIEDIRSVVRAVAGDRPVILVGHSLGGIYANLFARLHPEEVAGVVFVDSTAPEVLPRNEEAGLVNGGLGDLADPALRLQDPGLALETDSGVKTARAVLSAGDFPKVPVVSLRAGPADLLAEDPQAESWYQALGDLGTPGETRRVADSGHNVQFDRPEAVVRAVTDVLKLATKTSSSTRLAVDSGTGVAGDRVVLTATITGSKAAEGVVTFKSGATVLGVAPVINGKASIATTDLPAGSSRVIAEYSGGRLSLPSRGEARVRLSEPSRDSRFISGVLAEVAKKYGIPGLTAAVVVGDKVTAGGAGVRQAGDTVPVRTGDRFANGSTTKAMTATLAGVLIEKGLIRWESSIGEVFPELKGTIRPELETATIEDFLRHRTGLVNGSAEDSSPALLALAESLAGSPSDVARREILPTLLNEPLAVKPGEFLYSNASYAVAAAMLERAGNLPYEQMMSKFVFDPLKMTSATFDTTSDIDASVPLGTDLSTGKPVRFDSAAYFDADPAVLRPAGTELRMNVADWAKFVRAQLRQEVGGVRLLSPQTIARLQSADSRPLSLDFGEGYASGWGTRPADWNGRSPSLGESIYHDGSDGYWLASVEAFPKSNFAVLIMTNNLVISKDGQALEYGAYDEIQKRLTERFAPKASPQSLPASQLVSDALVQARTTAGPPAMAAGVIINGQTAGLAATGVREAGKPGAVGNDDQFALGSNAKSMTATLAAILVEQKVIRWDSTIGDLFPEIRNRIKAYAGVTLEELLNHRGGFGDISTQADVSRYEQFQKSARFASEGRQAYVRDWMLRMPPANAGGVFNYSNVGYTVAGAMLERAANRSYEWLMREKLFQPLGMTSVTFNLSPASNGRQNQPVGHDEFGKPIPAGKEPLDLSSPAGGVSMTMADWAKYLRMHLGEPVNGIRLLLTESLNKLHTPDTRAISDESGTFRYGFGWRSTQIPLGEALGHEGAVPGFYSRAGIIPAKGIAIFTAVNELSDRAASAGQAVTDAIISKLAGQP